MAAAAVTWLDAPVATFSPLNQGLGICSATPKQHCSPEFQGGSKNRKAHLSPWKDTLLSVRNGCLFNRREPGSVAGNYPSRTFSKEDRNVSKKKSELKFTSRLFFSFRFVHWSHLPSVNNDYKSKEYRRPVTKKKKKFLPQLSLKFGVILKVPGETYMDLRKKEKKINKIF